MRWRLYQPSPGHKEAEMTDWRRRTGRIVTDSEGGAGGISVTIYKAGTTTKCTLKDNKAGSEDLANPFETNAQGVWAFFIDVDTLSDCDYELDIVFSKSGLGFTVMNEMYENHSMIGALSAGQVLEADFDATTFLYATADNTPEVKTPAEVRAILGLVIGTDVLAEQTIGIADDNLVEVDGPGAGAPASGEYARWTANGLEGRVASEVLSDLSGQATAAFSMNSQKITSLANPTAAQDAATKAYVDSLAQGLNVHAAVACATTANISLSGEQTLDGILTSTDRVLVKNQNDASENGVWVSAGGAWTRATDMDADDEVAASFVFVSDGTTFGCTGWVCTNEPESVVIGTDDIDWSQFSDAGYITVSTGLVKTGNDIAVDGVLEDLDTLSPPASDGQIIVATGVGAFAYESGVTLRTSIGGIETAIHDNVANEITAITAKTAPVGADEFVIEDSAASFVKKALTLSDLAYGNPPLGQAGDATWANRSYEGWEIFDTAHTYTVGSGQDFATLAAAAAALQGLILTARLTLQLQENITLTSDVTFTNLFSAGGQFRLDLNSYRIDIDDGCGFGVLGYGPFEFAIYDIATGGSIKLIADSLEPPYYMVNGMNGCLLNLNAITLDANNKAGSAAVRVYKSRGRLYNCTYSNGGSLTIAFVYTSEVSHVGFITVNASCVADRGSIIILSDGTVVTT